MLVVETFKVSKLGRSSDLVIRDWLNELITKELGFKLESIDIVDILEIELLNDDVMTDVFITL